MLIQNTRSPQNSNEPPEKEILPQEPQNEMPLDDTPADPEFARTAGMPADENPTIPGTSDDTGTSPGADFGQASSSQNKAAVSHAFQAGQVLGGRYEIRADIGQGGMGQVWKAFDQKLQVEVALKFLHSNLYADLRNLESLRREVRAAREVMSSNVCRVFDLIELEGNEVVSMELIDGFSLREILYDRGPLPLTEANSIARQFLAGLGDIHEAGLIHGDIKPANIVVTRTGRAVVMDFGLARNIDEGALGKISGTPAYMSPEQYQGWTLDARSDVYSSAITLAEMIGYPVEQDAGATRRLFLAGLHENPPQIPESPWKPILLKALDHDPKQRYASAQALSRALEEVTLRVEREDGRSPYPGLDPFTEEHAEFFFGREAEIEALWRKIERNELLALIGPSGAGKSSFIRAGLAPSKPVGWGMAICKPGNDPGARLLQALWKEFDTFPTLPPSGLPSHNLLALWREKYKEVLLVVDHFEELFTQNETRMQRDFIEYLGHAAREEGIHVLLCLRDDFLFHCSAHPTLTPIFTNLTPFGSLTGEALRRALVLPAQGCGYKFEDEELIDEMMAEVRQERGALPLLAFAAARLWDKRNRSAGLLTRAAYNKIEGVAGALAQHAEATLQKIGMEHESLVRDIFSNLVTAQGTRLSMNLDHLLSVFGNQKEETKKILNTLVEARLLLVYEDYLSSTIQQVQIIHESLLHAWPRLVRWRAQDAESAILRDQLRQAAALWDGRGRPLEMLWSGGSFREFQLWKDRYKGRLSAMEQAFASAMVEHETKKSRQAGVAIGTVIAVLLMVLGTLIYMYRNSEMARQKAEAARLLAVAKLTLENNPSASMALLLESMRWADDPLARRFAIEVLQKGPTALAFDTNSNSAWGVAFSPDGKWLASGTQDTSVWLWPQDGGPPKILKGHQERIRGLEFAQDGSYLATVGRDHTLKFWNLPEGKLQKSVDLDALSCFSLDPLRSQALVLTHKQNELYLRSIQLADGSLEEIARYPQQSSAFMSVMEPHGQYLLLSMGNRIGKVLLQGEARGAWIPLFEHEKEIWALGIHPSGKYLAAGDLTGSIRIWDLSSPTHPLVQTLSGHRGAIMGVKISPNGQLMASASLDGTLRLWSMKNLRQIVPEPLELRIGKLSQQSSVAFSQDGNWLASSSYGHPLVQIWPISKEYGQVFRGHQDATTSIQFSPDGQWLYSTSEDGSVRRWPLSANIDPELSKILAQADNDLFYGLDYNQRRNMLLLAADRGPVWLVGADGQSSTKLEGFASAVEAVAFSPDGVWAAAGGGVIQQSDAVIRLWNLDTQEIRILDSNARAPIYDLSFAPDGTRLAAAEAIGVRLWDLQSGKHKTLARGEFHSVQFSKDGQFLLMAESDQVWLYNLKTEENRRLEVHTGPSLRAAFSAALNLVVSGDSEGVIRVSSLEGKVAHLLLGHRESVRQVAISPDGQWIASCSDDNTVRLWKTPQGTPFHTLPAPEFLDKLSNLTNLRITPDETTSTGYRVEWPASASWSQPPSW